METTTTRRVETTPHSLARCLLRRVGRAEERDFHAARGDELLALEEAGAVGGLGADAVLVEAEELQDVGRTVVPAGPAEGTVAVGVAGADVASGVQEAADRDFRREGRGEVERRFAARPGVAHEAAGVASRDRRRVGIGAVRKQDSHDRVKRGCAGARRGVQGRFASVGQSDVGVGAAFQEVLAQPPVAVEDRAVQVEVRSQVVDRISHRQQVPDGTHVAVVSAPLDERHAVTLVLGLEWHQVKDEIGPSVADRAQ
eukprot:CAMPEP_0198649406 /NCGR_PEP_ID=MMETSP1467-20131203/4249_1 /TAXON_ID=1462469 /ORGANISM="unid. sp., Strain CCMP2135" /LENGTH=255 /DNA_ID=CAMNT_0044385191 /DNA_START=167 /DNA_END=931 /DNA_ORIENTATION=-